jgi:hypothetical protein
MPTIPGVNDGSRHAVAARRGGQATGKNIAVIAAIAGGMLLAVILAAWWMLRPRDAHIAQPADNVTPEARPAAAEAATNFASAARSGPTVAATVEELANAWSSKAFVFVKPITGEQVNARVVRLPGGVLWGFALKEPFGDCNLEYVTDLERLASQFGYQATHPMVVNSCHNTIYDPLKLARVGGDVWVRGEIVQGIGLRPPTAIDVQIKGHSIIAARME